VRRKSLGRFTEDDLYIATYRWEEGGSLELTDERTQFFWITAGSVMVGGIQYGPRTAIWSDFGETVTVTGELDAMAMCFGLPVVGD
jgi:hypothetical protein